VIKSFPREEEKLLEETVVLKKIPFLPVPFLPLVIEFPFPPRFLNRVRLALIITTQGSNRRKKGRELYLEEGSYFCITISHYGVAEEGKGV